MATTFDFKTLQLYEEKFAIRPGFQMSKRNTARAWQRMLSGRRLDLLDPSPLDVEIEDIAHGLARVARWNGQTKGAHAFSVAQHCVLVERLTAELSPRITREARLMALLHDAPEYVIGDLISPFKAAVGIDYKDFELRLLSAIHLRFGLPAKAPADLLALFKQADIASAYFEATQLAGFSAAEAKRYFGTPPKQLHAPRLVPLAASDAQAQFLERFRRLTA
jgi:5'-deoxynucleotidase YfbR-like HD superfamily hydrolase